MFSTYSWTEPFQGRCLVCPASSAADYQCYRTHGNSPPRRPGLVIQLEKVCDDSRAPQLLLRLHPNRSAVVGIRRTTSCITIVQRPKDDQLPGDQAERGLGAPARHPRRGAAPGPPPETPREGGSGPPRRGGSGPPPPGGSRGGSGGAPPGGVRAGGAEPHCDPPGVTPPSGGVKNAVFGRHLVLYNLVGFFPVLISGCGRIFGRGK